MLTCFYSQFLFKLWIKSFDDNFCSNFDSELLLPSSVNKYCPQLLFTTFVCNFCSQFSFIYLIHCFCSQLLFITFDHKEHLQILLHNCFGFQLKVTILVKFFSHLIFTFLIINNSFLLHLFFTHLVLFLHWCLNFCRLVRLLLFAIHNFVVKLSFNLVRSCHSFTPFFTKEQMRSFPELYFSSFSYLCDQVSH